MALFCVYTVAPSNATAQGAALTLQPDSTARAIVKEVRFSGTEFFSEEDLLLRVRTQSNRRFLGVPGITWWLWLYRLGESGALGDRLGSA